MLIASESSSALHVGHSAWDADEDFRALYAEHAGFVWANLRRLGVPLGDVEDAVQEVFVTVHRRADALRPDASVRGWLFAILRRVAFRKRRTLERRGRLHEALTREPRRVGDPQRQFERREAAELVDDFLADLDASKREVFVLAELEQMTAREIASTLGVKPNTVSSRLRAARQAFDRHFARVRAEDRRVDALEAARRGHRPTRRQQAHAFAAVLGQLKATTAAPVVAGATAVLAQVKIFAVTVGVGALALVGIEYATAPAEGEASLPVVASVTEDVRAPEVEPLTPLRAASPQPEPATPSVAPAPTATSAPSLRRSPPNAAVRPTTPTSSEHTSTLAAEAALLKRIRAARDAGDPARALRLASQHAQQYPSGVLESERRALRLAALCALGHDRQAREEAQALLQDDPNSPLGRRIATGCPK